MSETPSSPRRARRWLRRALLVLLALVLLALVAGYGYHRTLPRDELAVLEPGRLTVPDGVAGRTDGTGVVVTVTGGAGARVRISNQNGVVWESQPGRAFIGAGDGTLDLEEHRGYFWPTVAHDRTWTTQVLEEVSAADDAVVLRGSLVGDGAGNLRWSATVTGSATGAVLEVRAGGEASTSLALWSGREGNAAVHGLGEQFTDFDLDGRLVPVLVREQGVGRGEQPISLLADLTNRSAGGTEAMSYATWSSWVTEDLRGVRLDPDLPESHAFAVADTRAAGRVGLEVWAPVLRAELTAGDTPAQLVARQQAGTDRPGLAGWTSRGAVVGLQGGTEEVRRQVADLRAAGAEVAGVWLQDWTGQRTTSFGERLWWTWQLDEERYPGWQDLVADLDDDGIAVPTYVNPFLVDAGLKQDPSIRNLWSEAAGLGHLVEDVDGEPYALDQGGFDAFLVDLTDRAARDWYADVIATEVLGQGAEGFMADFGEGLPFDAVLADGVPLTEHNRWPALWARTVREACERAGQPDCVTWFRSGSLGMDADAPLFWNGDQLASFADEDGLASVLRGTFAAGLSGWPLVHSDIGGYTSIDAVVKDYTRSPELLARWAELEAFGVFMRTHEGNRPDVNTQVSDTDATRAAFARMTKVYAALAPYRRPVVREAVRTGVPAIRHPWLVVPGTDAAEVDTQFFLGASVLVVPVTEEGVDTVEVTLPPGPWRHLLTGDELEGDTTLEVEAPLGQPAAFVRTDDPWADRLTTAVAAALDD